MTNLEVLVFVAETHGNHFATMFPTPGIHMGILQQIVAHLTFVSGKYHTAKIINSWQTTKKYKKNYYLCSMKALVIHAAKLKERGEHMDRMLQRFGIKYKLIEEGDAGHINDEILNKYFRNGKENMYEDSSRTSCALKHFLAYEYMLEHGIDLALILEDDIVLHKNFVTIFEKSLKEYQSKYAHDNILISYEDSTLDLIPRSLRHKGQMLYVGTKDRTTGAYVINLNAAKTILNKLSKEKCDVPIDWYHDLLLKEGTITYLWCHPAIATQGSYTGAFYSSLSSKSNTLLKLRWWFKKNYKHLLYWFR